MRNPPSRTDESPIVAGTLLRIVPLMLDRGFASILAKADSRPLSTSPHGG